MYKIKRFKVLVLVIKGDIIFRHSRGGVGDGQVLGDRELEVFKYVVFDRLYMFCGLIYINVYQYYEVDLVSLKIVQGIEREI